MAGLLYKINKCKAMGVGDPEMVGGAESGKLGTIWAPKGSSLGVIIAGLKFEGLKIYPRMYFVKIPPPTGDGGPHRSGKSGHLDRWDFRYRLKAGNREYRES